jgi:hypothetical protein
MFWTGIYINGLPTDLREALKLEPANESVKQELRIVEGLIEKETAKVRFKFSIS